MARLIGIPVNGSQSPDETRRRGERRDRRDGKQGGAADGKGTGPPRPFSVLSAHMHIAGGTAFSAESIPSRNDNIYKSNMG